MVRELLEVTLSEDLHPLVRNRNRLGYHTRAWTYKVGPNLSGTSSGAWTRRNLRQPIAGASGGFSPFYRPGSLLIRW